MSPPNANDPLRTTDHVPDSSATDSKNSPEPARQAAPIDATFSIAGSDATGNYQPANANDGQADSTGREFPAPTIPGYEILGVLGRGGMGVVYKARHLALKRTVALKMILAGGHAGPRELARFRIEAEAVARLQHPNIVQIHEVGEADGHPYCALEFVEGGNLASKIGGKPMPSRASAELMEALARAMQLAHSRNVVHRDLKPANILLASPGPESGELIPKITDFGLARQLDSDSGETQAGAVMGTPSYMAPEQASGNAHEAGPAADIYALGAILYDCLTGRPPFKGKTVVETLDQVRTQEPTPPSRWQASVPLDLDTICLKCLQKEPESRYASAGQLADDLGRYLRGEAILARPVRTLERTWKWVKRNPALAAAAVVLVAASVISTLFWIDARNKGKIADEKGKVADVAKGDLATRTTELDQTRDLEAAAQAQKWLTPLAEVPSRALNDAEVAAFAALAGSDDERLEKRYLIEGIKPLSRRKLAARSPFAMQALVGLDARKREEVESILVDELAKLDPSDEARTVLALVAAGLGGLSPSSAAEVSSILLQAIARTSDPVAFHHLMQSLAAVASGLEPGAAARTSAEAAAILTKALAQTRDREVGNSLAQRLSALAVYLEPAEAVKTIAALMQIMKGIFSDQIVSDEPLAQCLSALAARIDPKEVAKTANTLAKEMSETSDIFRQKRLAQGLSGLASHMNPSEAATLLAQVIVNTKDNTSVRRLGKGLLAIAGRLEAKDAATAAATITLAVPKASDSFNRDSLVLTLEGVVGRPEPKVAAEAAAMLLQALTKEGINIFDITSLGIALWKVAGRLEPDEAAKAVDKITQIMAKSNDLLPNEALVLALMTAAARLEPKDAAKVVPTLMQAFAKLGNPGAHEELVQSLSALMARLDPEFAARTAADAVARIKQARMTMDYNIIMCLSRCLPAVAGNLDPKDAAEAAEAIVQVLGVIKEGHNALQPLTEGLSALAVRLEPKEAARLNAAAIASLTRAIDLANGNSPGSLPYLARSLSAVTARIEGNEAARVTAEAADKFAQALLNANDRDPNVLQVRLQGLSALAARLEPKDASAAAAAIMRVLTKEYGETQDQGFGISLQPDRTTTPTRVLAELLGDGPPREGKGGATKRLMSDQDLVELLKRPLCVGPARRTVLDQLQSRNQRTFANQWDFVRFAEGNNLVLDFTRAPRP